MSKHRTYVWHIAWSNPYTPQPDDMPEVLLEVRRAGSSYPTPTEIQACWEEMRHYG